MARLIDVDKLVSKINKLEVFYFTGETDIAVHDCQMVELGSVLAEIDEAPPPWMPWKWCGVRKCKRYDEDGEYCKFWDGVRHPEHFCGEGVRKDKG